MKILSANVLFLLTKIGQGNSTDSQKYYSRNAHLAHSRKFSSVKISFSLYGSTVNG